MDSSEVLPKMSRNCCYLLIAINLIVLILVSYLTYLRMKQKENFYEDEQQSKVTKAKDIIKKIIIVIAILSAGSMAIFIAPNLLQMM